MEFQLNRVELRVLGALLEKDLATPEYYPLSLNALVLACNQKTNREPVLSLTEDEVTGALDSLRIKKLCFENRSSGRVVKFGHNLQSLFNLVRKETAILCVLMLRGPQTLGELRSRTGRMAEFTDLAEVEESLANLSELGLLKMLPRRPGQKESRYVQLLSGEPDPAEEPDSTAPAAPTAPSPEGDRLSALEREIKELREELIELKKMFSEFKSQFD